MYQFVSELEAIKTSLDVLNVNLQKSSEAENALAKYYETGSQSSVASLAKAPETQQILNRYGKPFSSTPPDDPTLRQQLGDYGQRTQTTGATPPSAGGQTGGPSRPLPPWTKDFQFFDEDQGGGSSWLEMPQYWGGQFTSQDLLKMGGRIGAKAQSFGESKDWSSLASAGSILGQGSSYLAKYAPHVSMLKQYTGQARDTSRGWENYAGSLGYQQEGFGSSIDLGPLGSFRPPFINPAFRQGVAEQVDSFSQAMSYAGLSTGEAGAIKQDLASRGWYPDQKQGESMFDLFAKLHETNPEIEAIPGTRDLVDKATRQGTTSMSEMLETLKGIPEAAKNAHISMDQFVADLDAFGEYNQSIGGTHLEGQRLGSHLSTISGQPPGAMMGMMQSPWIQSSVFRSTGQPPWMQGMLPAGMRSQAAIQGFFDAARSVGRPDAINSKIAGTGFSEHVSGIEQQAAMMHEFFMPETSPETIMKFLKMGPDGLKKRNDALRTGSAWMDQASEIMRNPRIGDSKRDLVLSMSRTKEGGLTFGDLYHDLSGMKTADGHQLLSQDDKRRLRAAGQDAHGEDKVERKFEELKEIMGQKAHKYSDNTGSPSQTVTLDLSPAARRLLELPGKKARYKLEVGSGERGNLNAAYAGYTDPLLPTTGLTNSGQYVGNGNG